MLLCSDLGFQGPPKDPDWCSVLSNISQYLFQNRVQNGPKRPKVGQILQEQGQLPRCLTPGRQAGTSGTLPYPGALHKKVCAHSKSITCASARERKREGEGERKRGRRGEGERYAHSIPVVSGLEMVSGFQVAR